MILGNGFLRFSLKWESWKPFLIAWQILKKKSVQWRKWCVFIALWGINSHAVYAAIAISLLAYAKRLDGCKFGDEKPAYAKCSVHYQPAMREQIRVVMRFQGLLCPLFASIETIEHYLPYLFKQRNKDYFFAGSFSAVEWKVFYIFDDSKGQSLLHLCRHQVYCACLFVSVFPFHELKNPDQ